MKLVEMHPTKDEPSAGMDDGRGPTMAKQPKLILMDIKN